MSCGHQLEVRKKRDASFDEGGWEGFVPCPRRFKPPRARGVVGPTKPKAPAAAAARVLGGGGAGG